MITERQCDLLRFLDRYLTEHGHAPSYQQMADGIGLQSRSGINRMVLGLEERGFVRHIPHKDRAIEILRRPWVEGDPLTAVHDLLARISRLPQLDGRPLYRLMPADVSELHEGAARVRAAFGGAL